MVRATWMPAAVVVVLLSSLTTTAQQTAQPQTAQPQTAAPTPADSTNLGRDANGNPLRLARKTGHVSNYDETKIPSYTLPDPLRLTNGKRVDSAETWRNLRRPELLELYKSEIYGRIPAKTPRVTWKVGEVDKTARDGAAVKKLVVGRIG